MAHPEQREGALILVAVKPMDGTTALRIAQMAAVISALLTYSRVLAY